MYMVCLIILTVIKFPFEVVLSKKKIENVIFFFSMSCHLIWRYYAGFPRPVISKAASICRGVLASQTHTCESARKGRHFSYGALTRTRAAQPVKTRAVGSHHYNIIWTLCGIISCACYCPCNLVRVNGWDTEIRVEDTRFCLIT